MVSGFKLRPGGDPAPGRRRLGNGGGRWCRSLAVRRPLRRGGGASFWRKVPLAATVISLSPRLLVRTCCERLKRQLPWWTVLWASCLMSNSCPQESHETGSTANPSYRGGNLSHRASHRAGEVAGEPASQPDASSPGTGRPRPPRAPGQDPPTSTPSASSQKVERHCRVSGAASSGSPSLAPAGLVAVGALLLCWAGTCLSAAFGTEPRAG